MISKIRISLLSLVLILSCLLWLIATTAGTRLALKALAYAVPGSCHLNLIQGNLLQGVVIDGLHMKNQWINVDIKEMILRWSLSKNSLKHFIITEASLKQVMLAKPHEPPFLNMSLLQVQAKHETALVTWQGLNLPLSHVFYLKSDSAQITLTGNWMQFLAQGEMNLGGKQIPMTVWQVAGKGSIFGLTEANASAKLLQGAASVTGQVHWIPPITWQGQVHTTSLNFKGYQPSIDAMVNVNVATQGYFEPGEPLKLTVQLQELTGSLSGYPLTGSGNFSIENHNYVFQQLQLQSKQASLKLQGQYGKTTDISWLLNIPSLQHIIVNDTGSISSQGNLVTDKQLDKLNGQARLQVSELCIAPYCIDQASVSGNFNSQQLSLIQFKLGKLSKQNKTLIKQASLLSHLNRNQGDLEAKVMLAQQTLDLIANGQRQNQMLNINVSHLALTGDPLMISNRQSIRFMLKKTKLTFQPFCLNMGSGQFCIKALSMQKEDNGKLSGKLNAFSPSLNWLNTFNNKVQHLEGMLNIDLTMDNEKHMPDLSGNISLDKASFDISAYGLNIKKLDANLKLSHNQFDYGLKFENTPGDFQLQGKGNLNPLTATLHMEGKNITVYNTQDANIVASPNLTVNMQEQNIDIEGKILIDKANITPKDFTSVSKLPDDVTWLDDEKTKRSNWHITQKVNIELGDDVAIHYAGLDAKLTGNITVNQGANGTQTAVGSINMPTGKYKAYGQSLTIKNGLFTFTGGPIDNPGLSISATRTIQNFTAPSKSSDTAGPMGSTQTVGVKISGTLNNPTLTLFSEPTGLNQSDILSYLLVGRPSSQATSSQAGVLMNALGLLNLGQTQAGEIKNQLNKAFGLDELGVSSQQEYSSTDNKVVDNTSVVLGKTFASRLYVNYSIGLLEPINILQISYKLSHGFQLQSEHSNNGNGVDLFYTWSK